MTAPTPPLVLADSRRLTGPSLLLDRPGAVLDVKLAGHDPDGAIAAWQAALHGLLAALGWGREDSRVRRFPGGASLAFTAPLDALFTATEVNEAALAAANAALTHGPVPDQGAAVERLRALAAQEANPRLLALAAAARARGASCLVDTEAVSVGTGAGSFTWPLTAVPAPDEVPWAEVREVPVVLVTGCNGKTTTVRLLSAVLAAAGRVTGFCCSDTVTVAGERLDEGDWSGPGGARRVLRDRRTEVAVLETARGGILRRGLAVTRADAAIITNVAEDHFGEFGISDLAGLAEAQFVVTRALGPGSRLVLNADDPVLVGRSHQATAPVIWFSLDPANPWVRAHVAEGGEAVVAEDTDIVLLGPGARVVVAPLASVPITLGGAARHNVANALGVAALATRLGLAPEAVARGLAGFRGTAEQNPGRLNIFQLGGVTVVADFAHNPHGMAALVALAQALPARRRLLLLGQAGDRDDSALTALARTGWTLRPDRIVLKEMDQYLRGRAAGEITALLREALLGLGVPHDRITRADSEYEGVLAALTWAQPDDLLVLPVHSERDRVLGLLARLEREQWRPGAPLPASAAVEAP